MPTLTDQQTRAVETLDQMLRLTTQALEHPAPMAWLRDRPIDWRALIVKQGDES